MEKPLFNVCSSRDDSSISDAEPNAIQTGSRLAKLSVLMPVYNERWTLAKIVRRVLDSPVPLEIELVAVDDCSSDGSWKVLTDLAAGDPRIRPFRHEQNQGKGAAIRTAIEKMTGEVAVIQDADLEYDPNEFPVLLEPILEGKADAVFGSRFAGHSRRVLYFWHSLGNRLLTLFSNMLNDLNLTDMETCYKMVRADVLRSLCLSSNTFTLEPEITCRLAQYGAKIYEVPISYSGRSYQEGKKIRPFDGVKAVAVMLHRRFIDTQFTHHTGFYTLRSMGRADKFNRWILDQVKPFLGNRVLEAGSGIGNLSTMLLNRERLVLVENEAAYIPILNSRFGSRDNVRVDCGDLTQESHFGRWKDERLDTVFCSNVLEHIKGDDDVLRRFHDVLEPGGHCVIVVPAGKWLYNSLDEAVGHHRRYCEESLREKMAAAGFEVVSCKRFARLAAAGWAVSGRLMKRRSLSPWQTKWFERLFPLTKMLEHVLPWPGMSLIMVGRKPQQEPARKAA